MTTVDLMTIGDLTGDEVVVLDPQESLLDVAELLVSAEIGAVVLGTRSDVAGIVSERDIVRAVADKVDLATTSAASVASTVLVWADATAPIEDVAEQMMEKWVRHVLIEQDGALVGIVSARDVLGVLASAGQE